MIVFYGKPGCLTNRKQYAMLRSAGYEPQLVNLLEHPWRVEELEMFFGELPVAEWFNPAAPTVKSGSVDPENLDRREALARLVAEPVLIRRPLLASGERRMAGFDPAQLRERMGIELVQESAPPEGCSHPAEGVCP